MALIVPNAVDTTSGNKYVAFDQAEPDQVDFEILSHGRSGVLNGCEVTSLNSANSVAVAGGTIVLDGLPYTVTGVNPLDIHSGPADVRFDLVVARVTAGVASLFVVQGANSAVNPTFPRSASVVTGAPSTSLNVNFATDVVLAALYRDGPSGTVTPSHVVDKRVFRTTSGPYMPIGGAFAWPCNGTAPAGCLELNGQGVATAAYPDLFAQYQYLHGGSGATFLLPNWNGKYLRGTTATSGGTAPGTTVGADSVQLTIPEMPTHRHGTNTGTPSTNTSGAASTSTTSGATPGATGGTNTAATGGTNTASTGGESQNHTHTTGTMTTSEIGAHSHESPGLSNSRFMVAQNTMQSEPYRGGEAHGSLQVLTTSFPILLRYTIGNGAHTHTVSGTTNGNNRGHTHSMQSHTHNMPHTHNMAHTHTMAHTHSLQSHTHTISNEGGNASHENRPFSEHTRWMVRATI